MLKLLPDMLKSTDTVIIGGGIFGQVIAKALRAQGKECIIIDRGEREAGSKAAACLMAPNWFGTMGKDKYKQGIALLDQLYGVEEIPFEVTVSAITKVSKTLKINWVNPGYILVNDHVLHANVESIRYKTVYLQGAPGEPLIPLHCNNIIVAAGIWSEQLLSKMVSQSPMAGCAFLYKGTPQEKPLINYYRPYKQLVAFDRGDGTWVNDGMTKQRRMMTNDLVEEAQVRCHNFLGQPEEAPIPIVGIRPVVKGKAYLMEEYSPNIWVVSGGGKNGTLAAAYCASEIVKQIK